MPSKSSVFPATGFLLAVGYFLLWLLLWPTEQPYWMLPYGLRFGALLLAPKTRRLGATLAALLFIAVFPANINMVRLWWDKPLPLKLGAIARLPLQIPMITEALKVRRTA